MSAWETEEKGRQEFIRQANGGRVENNHPLGQHFPGGGHRDQQDKYNQAAEGEPIFLKNTPGFLQRSFGLRQLRLPQGGLGVGGWGWVVRAVAMDSFRSSNP